jgi:paraquat-inducible protein B
MTSSDPPPARPAAEPSPPDETLAEPVFRKSRGFSLVWLVPLVAAGIGIWLAVATVLGKGPSIEITFVTAGGLEAGKTQVKFRDVTVGLVEDVRVAPDLSGVVVRATMTNSFEPHLNEETRFWVVRPRVGTGGVSGLDTLLSGAYVEVDPGGGADQRSFVGLEIPPLIRSDAAGTEYSLIAETLGSASRGAPILFRGLEVGQVLGYQLTEDGQRFEIPIFINAPHDRLVNEASNFWDVSGISIEAGVDGVAVRTSGLQALLIGGIEFDSPGGSQAEPAAPNTVFALFRDRESIGEQQITERVPFIVDFDSSTRGLRPGAPVEFRGIRLGSVTHVGLKSDLAAGEASIRVQINLEPQRVDGLATGLSIEEDYARIDTYVRNGLRAQLQTGNLLTGELFIDLDFRTDVPPDGLDRSGPVPRIPAVPTDLQAITASVTGLLQRLAELPLEDIVDNIEHMTGTLDSLVSSPELASGLADIAAAGSDLRRLLAQLDANAVPMLQAAEQTIRSVQATVVEARGTLQSTNALIGDNSTLRFQLERSLQELATAARSIREFAASLERDPGSLIRGRREF